MTVHILTKHAGQYTIHAMPEDERLDLLEDFEKGVSRTLTFMHDDVAVHLLRSQVVCIELEPKEA